MKILDTKVKLTKSQKELFEDMTIFGAAPETITNPFSKEEITLPPEAVAFYDVIIGSMLTLNKNPSHEKMFEIYDNAKEVFLVNWPEAYRKLID